MREHFSIAFKNLMHRKLRTWLTMLGIFIGIAAVVALVAMGNGLQKAVQNEFEQLGFNRIMINPAGASFGPLSGGYSEVKLTQDDIDEVRKASGVKYAAGLIATSNNIKFKDETEAATIFFHDTDKETLNTVRESNLFNIEFGREFRKSDTKKIIIGYDVANKLFDKKVHTGNEIEVFGQKFEVIGITKKTGSPVHDGAIRIPLPDYQGLMQYDKDFTMIVAIIDKNAQPEEVKENIEKKLRKSRDVEEGEEDFSVETAKEIIDTVFQIFGIIQAVIIGIAAISLVVGAVGIANTMYTSVLERTKEIGIMKAIGATNKDIGMIFLFESGILGLAGGVIGILLGLGIGELVAYAARIALDSNVFQSSVSISFIIWMLIFAFVLGSVSGVAPALQASKLKPVDALRYE